MRLSPEQASDVYKTFHGDLKTAVAAFGVMPVYNLNQRDIREKLMELLRATCEIAQAAGLDPVKLTNDVHMGRE